MRKSVKKLQTLKLFLVMRTFPHPADNVAYQNDFFFLSLFIEAFHEMLVIHRN